MLVDHMKLNPSNAPSTPAHIRITLLHRSTEPPSSIHRTQHQHKTTTTTAQSFGEADISGEELHEILREIDTNMNGQVELDEYLQVGGWVGRPKPAERRYLNVYFFRSTQNATQCTLYL